MRRIERALCAALCLMAVWLPARAESPMSADALRTLCAFENDPFSESDYGALLGDARYVGTDWAALGQPACRRAVMEGLRALCAEGAGGLGRFDADPLLTGPADLTDLDPREAVRLAVYLRDGAVCRCLYVDMSAGTYFSDGAAWCMDFVPSAAARGPLTARQVTSLSEILTDAAWPPSGGAAEASDAARPAVCVAVQTARGLFRRVPSGGAGDLALAGTAAALLAVFGV